MPSGRHSFVSSAGHPDALLFSDSGPSLCTTGRDFFLPSPRPGIYFYQHFLLFHSCQSLTPRRQLVETGKIIVAPFLHALTRCALFRRGKGMLWTVWFTSLAWHIEGSSCLSWNIWDSRDQVSRRHQGGKGVPPTSFDRPSSMAHYYGTPTPSPLPLPPRPPTCPGILGSAVGSNHIYLLIDLRFTEWAEDRSHISLIPKNVVLI